MAISILRDSLPEFTAGIFGDRLHIVVNDVSTAIPKIKSVLSEKSITIESIREIEPTLEDIFVSLLTRQEAEKNESAL